jgi:hypothetical protein
VVRPFVVKVAPGARLALERLGPSVRQRLQKALETVARQLALRSYPEEGCDFRLSLGGHEVTYSVDTHLRVVQVEAAYPRGGRQES